MAKVKSSETTEEVVSFQNKKANDRTKLTTVRQPGFQAWEEQRGSAWRFLQSSGLGDLSVLSSDAFVRKQQDFVVDPGRDRAPVR